MPVIKSSRCTKKLQTFVFVNKMVMLLSQFMITVVSVSIFEALNGKKQRRHCHKSINVHTCKKLRAIVLNTLILNTYVFSVNDLEAHLQYLHRPLRGCVPHSKKQCMSPIGIHLILVFFRLLYSSI